MSQNNYNQPKSTLAKTSNKVTAGAYLESLQEKNEELKTQMAGFIEDAKQAGIECTPAQILSRIQTIATLSKDDTPLGAVVEAAKLSLLTKLEANDLCIINSVPTLKKPALLKVAQRAFSESGILASYQTKLYDRQGQETLDKPDSAITVIQARVSRTATGKYAGFAGETIELQGPRVFADRYKGHNSHDMRGVLQDMALRAAIRMYFPEAVGSAVFDDEEKFKAEEVIEVGLNSEVDLLSQIDMDNLETIEPIAELAPEEPQAELKSQSTPEAKPKAIFEGCD